MEKEKCNLWTNAAGVSKDCDGLQSPDCLPCTRRKPRQLREIVEMVDPDSGETSKCALGE